MRTVARRIAHRLGHRGATLTLKGTIAAMYGVSLWTTPPVPRPLGMHLLLGMMSLHCWGTTLVAAGVIAMVHAWVPEGRDWPGFAALVLAWLPWALSYFVSWWPEGANPRGWVVGLIFAAFAGVPAVAATWSEDGRGRGGA